MSSKTMDEYLEMDEIDTRLDRLERRLRGFSTDTQISVCHKEIRDLEMKLEIMKQKVAIKVNDRKRLITRLKSRAPVKVEPPATVDQFSEKMMLTVFLDGLVFQRMIVPAYARYAALAGLSLDQIQKDIASGKAINYRS